MNFSGGGALIGGAAGAGIGLLAGGGLGGALLGGAGGALIGGLLGGRLNPNPHLPAYAQEDLYDTLLMIKQHPHDHKYYRAEDALPPMILMPDHDILAKVELDRGVSSRHSSRGFFLESDLGLAFSNRLPNAMMPMRYFDMVGSFFIHLEENMEDLSDTELEDFIHSVPTVVQDTSFLNMRSLYYQLEDRLLDMICLRIAHDLEASGSKVITYHMLLDALLRNPHFDVNEWLE